MRADFESLIRMNIFAVVPLLLQIMGLSFFVAFDAYIEKYQKKVMLIVNLLVFALVLQNIGEYCFDVDGTMPYMRLVFSVIGYCVRPAIIVLFIHIICKNKKHLWAWTLVGVNVLIHLTAFFSDICFTIRPDNRFYRGPLGNTCLIISSILLVLLLLITIKNIKPFRKAETIIPLFNVLIIIAAVIVDTRVINDSYISSFLLIAITSATLFYYIWLHLRFVREHEIALMAEQRIQIMMSQIQPHFLYNTLSTIQALCKIDPQKAFETTEKFGTYLRQNIDSLSQPNMIPIKKELEHTGIYTEIEQIRFDNIEVIYDINNTDFTLPALTIQPIVENAIKHGVRIRKKGVVKISINKKGHFHEIVIIDNGKGFDVKTVKEAEGEHIGIQNVRERLKKMCGGSLTVESEENVGTKVTILIPDNKQ